MNADIPGVADSRLAGWRTTVQTKDAEEQGSLEQGDVSNLENISAACVEPLCGDVVEVRE